MNLFLGGLITGFSVAAPIGPVSLLIVNNTLCRGTLYGFGSALGASTADACYGLAAALGISLVVDFGARHHDAVQYAGGILIILVGLYLFFRNNGHHRAAHAHPPDSVFGASALVFTSTLSNPFTVCFFLSVFSAFAGGNAGGSWGRAIEYAAGIFAGTAAWWVVFTVSVGLLKKAIHERGMMLIRKFSGIAIAAIGIYALLR